MVLVPVVVVPKCVIQDGGRGKRCSDRSSPTDIIGTS